MKKRFRVVGLGDSTTAGTPLFLSPVEAPPKGEGDERSQYAYWMAKEHQDWEVLNKGINGERTDQILARFDRDVVAETPDILVVLGGVNDIYQKHPAKVPEGNLAKIYDRAKVVRLVTVACTVLPYNTLGGREEKVMREVNAWIEDEAKRRSNLFCDTRAAVASPSNPYRLNGSPDGLHPDIEGYRKMGEAIAKTISDNLPTIRG